MGRSTRAGSGTAKDATDIDSTDMEWMDMDGMGMDPMASTIIVRPRRRRRQTVQRLQPRQRPVPRRMQHRQHLPVQETSSKTGLTETI